MQEPRHRLIERGDCVRTVRPLTSEASICLIVLRCVGEEEDSRWAVAVCLQLTVPLLAIVFFRFPVCDFLTSTSDLKVASSKIVNVAFYIS